MIKRTYFMCVELYANGLITNKTYRIQSFKSLFEKDAIDVKDYMVKYLCDKYDLDRGNVDVTAFNRV